MGIHLSGGAAKAVTDLYREWWETMACNFPRDFGPRFAKPGVICGSGETSTERLKKRWKMPPDPGDPFRGLALEFRDYGTFLRCYYNFADIYVSIHRVWPETRLYFETDAFLNYLFHHDGRPSHVYMEEAPRRLDEDGRNGEIRRYALMFRDWVGGVEEDIENRQWRERASDKIRGLLAIDRIDVMSSDDVEQVISWFNCMNSLKLNKTMFLNPRNNDIRVIRSAWNNLLYGGEQVQVRMTKCNSSLKRFGRSSIQELLGFFNPDAYPIRNRNSSAGLRFFGYEVSAY